MKRSANIASTGPSLQIWLLARQVGYQGMIIIYLQFYQFAVHPIGELIQVLIFICVRMTL
jgi:hypothetical protein